MNRSFVTMFFVSGAALAACWFSGHSNAVAAAEGKAAAQPLVGLVGIPNEGIAPQAAVDERGRLHLIYFKGDAAHGDISYVRSEDGGRSFSKPLQVNSQSGSGVAIGTVRVPQLTIGKGGRVHVAWMGSTLAEPKMGGKSAPMLYTRLNDAGDAFEPQRNLIVDHPGLDGGGSVAADPAGNVYVAWHAPKDVAGEANRYVWIRHSADEGKTFAPESAVNTTPTGACGCCGMKVAATASGEVYVMYRSATQQVNRDLRILVSQDHGKTFADASIDPWNLRTCAMSTAALGSATSKAEGANRVVAAWETQGHIHFATASHAKFSPIVSVPVRADNQKHPAVAVNDRGEFVIAWAEGTGWNRGGQVAWQAYNADSSPIAGQAGRKDGLPAWSMPAVFVKADQTFGIVVSKP